MNQRIRNNMQKVARGGWNRLGKEEQAELTGADLVHLDEYTDPMTLTITDRGNQALKEQG